MYNLWRRHITLAYNLVTGHSFYHIDFDAKKCYDKIIPEIAALASVLMGVHHTNAQWICLMLQSFRHIVLLQDIPSTGYYEDSEFFHILGIGKGIGWSPTVWGLVNDITMTLMEYLSPGVIFRSPLNRDIIFSFLEAYVGDVYGGVNSDGICQFN